MWNEARSTEHPLETLRRIAGLTQAQLNARLAEYAQHQVSYDYSNRSHFAPFLASMYGAGFITAYNGVPVDAVNQAAGHYAIPDPLAPSDYGYNKIKLVPSGDGALIRLHFKGHVDTAAQSGWSYGFVAVKNGTPRYGPVSSASDATVTFQTQPGRRRLYLVVLGAPPRSTTTRSSTGTPGTTATRTSFRVRARCRVGSSRGTPSRRHRRRALALQRWWLGLQLRDGRRERVRRAARRRVRHGHRLRQRPGSRGWPG